MGRGGYPQDRAPTSARPEPPAMPQRPAAELRLIVSLIDLAVAATGLVRRIESYVEQAEQEGR